MSRQTQRARPLGQTRYPVARMTLHTHIVDNPASERITAGQRLCDPLHKTLCLRYLLAQVCRCMAELWPSGSRVSWESIAYTAERAERPARQSACSAYGFARSLRLREGRRSCAQIRNAHHSRARGASASRADQSHCTSGANGYVSQCHRAGTGQAGAAWP